MKTQPKTTLQKLVLEQMIPTGTEMDTDEINRWTCKLPQLNRDIFKGIRQLLFSKLPAQLIRRQLGHIQHECVFMMDALHHCPEVPEPVMALRQEVLKCLGTVLEQLQTHHRKYFNDKADMPEIEYRQAVQSVELRMDLMVAMLKKHCTDKTLQALIVGKMAGLQQQVTGSYHKMRYLAHLQNSVIATGNEEPGAGATGKFQLLLLALDFNTAGFIAYYKNKIAAELAEIYDEGLQLECLYQYKKKLTVLCYPKGFMRFDPKMGRTRDVLLTYVNAELAYLEKKHPVTAASSSPPPLHNNYRVQVCFSVDVLACFFKLLVKAGVINRGPKSHLLLFVAKNFRTPGITDDTISVKSLDNKYNLVEKSTANSLRTVLVRMLEMLDDEFI